MLMSDNEKIIVFEVNNHLIGLPISVIEEVFQTREILKIPRTSKVLRGIVNLRGQIISIFSLSEILFGNITSDIQEDKEFDILLVNYQNHALGLLVDSIVQLVSLPVTSSNSKDKNKIIGLKNPEVIQSLRTMEDGSQVTILDINLVLDNLITVSESKKTKTDEEFQYDLNQYTLPSDTQEEEVDDFDYDQFTLPDESSDNGDIDLDALNVEKEDEE